MIPSPEALASGLRFLARRHGIRVSLDLGTLESLLHQAGELAAGRGDDEPAALFFAAARHGRLLGPAADELIPLLAYGQAGALGFDLAANKTELAILRLRVVKRAIPFDELRAWFAERLRPLLRP